MKKIVCLLLAVLAIVSAAGQERKKVAVVLCGGGAKGMAHIGALRVIEQAGLPIDIVTGTSMGSLIGGLYSIGYDANAIDSVVRSQDWSYVITDRENLSEQSLADRKKQNTYALQRGMTFGLRNDDDGGIIKGKNLAVLFRKLCMGFTDSLDFNRDLPIPFACVATNIVDNTEYDFHSGSLPQAMRASMAIPAVFSPVRIGDMVLVDGGLRNNYPADIAREMGADIVIGVTVQGEAKTAKDLGGTMSILNQIIDVNCKNKYDDNLNITDVHIRVNTEGYGSASFNAPAIKTLIRRGEEAAMAHWDDLQALKPVIGIDDSFQPVRPKPFHPDAMREKLRVTAFVFENTTEHDEYFIRKKFSLADIDSANTRLEERIATCMRTDLFYQSVDTRTVPDGDGYRIVFTAGNRKNSQLGVGFRFDTEEMVAMQLNADFPLKTNMPTDIDLAVRLGKRMMGRADLTFHPLSFTRPVLSYVFRRNDIDIYDGGDRDYSILYNHHEAELLPVNFDIRNFNFRAGLRWDYYHYSGSVLSAHAKEIKLKNDHYFSYRAQAGYNSENDWYFPTRGARFNAAYAYVTDNFSKLDGEMGMSEVSASWRKTFAVNSRFSLQPMVYGRLLFGSVVPHVLGNVIGGEWFGHYVEQQMPFVGMGNVEYAEHHFTALQLQAQERITSNNYILLRLAAAQHAHDLKDLPHNKTLIGGQLAYYYQTMLGPLGLTLGYSNKTRELYSYINIGFEF